MSGEHIIHVRVRPLLLGTFDAELLPEGYALFDGRIMRG